jgi:hypothetical protein
MGVDSSVALAAVTELARISIDAEGDHVHPDQVHDSPAVPAVHHVHGLTRGGLVLGPAPRIQTRLHGTPDRSGRGGFDMPRAWYS